MWTTQKVTATKCLHVVNDNDCNETDNNQTDVGNSNGNNNDNELLLLFKVFSSLVFGEMKRK